MMTFSTNHLNTVFAEEGKYEAFKKLTYDLNRGNEIYEYDEDGNKIQNLSGMTWNLGNEEMPVTDGKVFDLISNVVIENVVDNDYGYDMADGVLTIHTARDDSYASGNVTLQVNQYDENNNLLATGLITVYTIAEPSAAE